ncbi:MAG: carbohydrate kinase [Fibrobacteres bacterium]|nr:carbohydrate kinase [Fibrobacterota bacterium]
MKLLCFGEVLWDIINGVPHIGGAPFNVAAHSSRLGIETWLVSAVGDDKLGRRALEEISRYGIHTEYVNTIKGAATGTVQVLLSKDGQPSYDITENAAWDNISLEKAQLQSIVDSKFDLFLYGTLSQRSKLSRKSLAEIRNSLTNILSCCDINIRQNFWSREIIIDSINGTKLLKLNRDEYKMISRELFDIELSPLAFGEKISSAFGTEIIVITLGADGVMIFHNGKIFKVPGIAVKVIDTVGAGDAFCAAFLNGILSGKSPLEAAENGNKLGAYVASRHGAVPD